MSPGLVLARELNGVVVLQRAAGSSLCSKVVASRCQKVGVSIMVDTILNHMVEARDAFLTAWSSDPCC